MKKNFFTIKDSCQILRLLLPLAKLDMAGSRLVSNGLIFSNDIPVVIQY